MDLITKVNKAREKYELISEVLEALDTDIERLYYLDQCLNDLDIAGRLAALANRQDTLEAIDQQMTNIKDLKFKIYAKQK